ncbi:lysosome-associated membrane glycoprotein 2 isoform 2-T2 [Clarias gariepinus]|uniref:lysosome-associated membrane glycoprotein 2 isoform X2 n=1 Tax=Clarias gariepinus TaxID=13013 RepID=UPI00234D86B2|nr:lysosome-associated membrane glycoprotein 2 isoform X2 [Clarias gariepinus]
MFRCVCLFVLLPLCVFGQAEMHMSKPSKSLPNYYAFWDETNASTIPPATIQLSYSTRTPTTPQATSSTAAPTTPQTSNSTTASTTPQTSNSTTASTTPQTSNSTTAPTTPQTTNSTVAPTTPQTTNSTVAPTTSQTTNFTTGPTTPQTTSSTTAAPTTPPMPNVGDYVVRAEWNSSACVMARMGLQFSIKMVDTFQVVNLDPSPNVTNTSGTCGNNGSDSALTLTSDKITVQFSFTNQSSKFFLSALRLTVMDGSGTNFTVENSTLSLWEASLGSSYMCKKEQSFNITDALVLNTFELQVQPFAVMNDQFSTVEECFLDTDLSFVVPIAVGVALGFLIILVFVSYLIGQRKSRTGYQSV